MLSPEREKEIRKFLDNGSAGHPDSWYEDYKMFLSEIDRLRLAWQSDCDEFEDIEKERDHLREKLAVAVEILEKIDLNCNSNMGIASFSDQCFINLITLPKEWVAEALAKIRGEK